MQNIHLKSIQVLSQQAWACWDYNTIAGTANTGGWGYSAKILTLLTLWRGGMKKNISLSIDLNRIIISFTQPQML